MVAHLASRNNASRIGAFWTVGDLIFWNGLIFIGEMYEAKVTRQPHGKPCFNLKIQFYKKSNTNDFYNRLNNRNKEKL